MKGISVLIIDDETSVLKLLTIVLSRNGYQVDTADSGEEGINKLQSNDYGLVITDMVMGKMSGYFMLESVRKMKGGSIPVIAMSGDPNLMDGHLFDAFILKPCSLKLLVETVQKLLSPTGDAIPVLNNQNLI
jgi:DNA-binding response OmpR family regulator